MLSEEARDECTPDIDQLIQTSQAIDSRILSGHPPAAAAVRNDANGLTPPRPNIQAANIASIPVRRPNITTTVN